MRIGEILARVMFELSIYKGKPDPWGYVALTANVPSEFKTMVTFFLEIGIRGLERPYGDRVTTELSADIFQYKISGKANEIKLTFSPKFFTYNGDIATFFEKLSESIDRKIVQQSSGWNLETKFSDGKVEYKSDHLYGVFDEWLLGNIVNHLNLSQLCFSTWQDNYVVDKVRMVGTQEQIDCFLARIGLVLAQPSREFISHVNALSRSSIDEALDRESLTVAAAVSQTAISSLIGKTPSSLASGVTLFGICANVTQESSTQSLAASSAAAAAAPAPAPSP